MNLLVLMAGSNAVFEEVGYQYPKNLIEIEGNPMAQWVIENLIPLKEHYDGKFTFFISAEENKVHHTSSVLELLAPRSDIIQVPSMTAGAVCTALLAIEKINNPDPLIIVNGDQLLKIDLPSVVKEFQERQLDAGSVVFESVHPRWSYVKCDAEGYIIETTEKRPISNLATAGFYYFAKGKDFVDAAMQMIKKDARVNDLFYVCPVFNEMILNHARIGVKKIVKNDYVSFASPQGVNDFIQLVREKNS